MTTLVIPSEDAAKLYYGQDEVNGLRFIESEFYETWRWGSRSHMVVQDILTEKCYYAVVVSQQEGDHWWLSLEEEGPTTTFYQVEKVPVTTYRYERVS